MRCALITQSTLARYLALNNVAATSATPSGAPTAGTSPRPNRGRYREFYQADFDIVGKYAPMAADAEVLKVGPCSAVSPGSNLRMLGVGLS